MGHADLTLDLAFDEFAFEIQRLDLGGAGIEDLDRACRARERNRDGQQIGLDYEGFAFKFGTASQDSARIQSHVDDRGQRARKARDVVDAG